MLFEWKKEPNARKKREVGTKKKKEEDVLQLDVQKKLREGMVSKFLKEKTVYLIFGKVTIPCYEPKKR